MRYRELFPVVDRHIWLNHAAISPWPRPVSQAMRAFVEDNAEHGPLHYADWMKVEASLRRQSADLMGADPDDLALIKNTSEGLSLIAAGLDWQPGDALVCCAGDFPSNLLPWRQLVPDYVEVREVPFDSAEPESALEQALDESVRLMAVSSVRYDSGVRLDLERLGRPRTQTGRCSSSTPSSIWVRCRWTSAPRPSISSWPAATNGFWPPRAWHCSGHGQKHVGN